MNFAILGIVIYTIGSAIITIVSQESPSPLGVGVSSKSKAK
jgi:hypothetical protein